MGSARLAVLSLLVSGPLCAQSFAPPAEVLAFKSGHSVVSCQVPVDAATPSVRLPLPPGIHGTIWVGSAELQVQRARAMLVEQTVENPVEDLAGTLRMVEGRRVRLAVQSGDGVTTLTGTLARLLGAAPEVRAGQEPKPAAPKAVVLRQQGETYATSVIPLARIAGIDIAGEDLPWTYRAAVKAPVLEVTFTPRQEDAAGSLGLAYMAGGLSWAPSYVLTLAGEGSGRLTGKAVVMNDLGDLQGTRVRLAIGYPNLRFSRVRSGLLPEVSIQNLRGMLGAGDRNAAQGVMSQVMANVFSRNTGASGGGPGGPAAPPSPVPGAQAEDLYVYDIGKLDLKRGERAYVPLIQEQLRVRHRYDWEIPDLVDRHARFRRRDPEETIPVWHVLKLHNRSGRPWTTAPILVRTQDTPLAQSLVTYTPPGSETVVRLTKALNLAGEHVEYRADPERADHEAIRLFGDYYQRILVNGRLELSNHGDKTVPVRVVKRFSGDLVEAGGKPSVKGHAKSLGRVNASRELTWEFELEAGKSWSADYTYRVLIRR